MENIMQTVRSSIKHWYIPLIIGILYIALGLFMLAVPIATYVALALLFAVSFLIAGLFETYFSVKNRKHLGSWGWYLAGGILSLVVGMWLAVYPAVSLLTLPFFVALVLLVHSFRALIFGFEMEDLGIVSWGSLALLSVLGILMSMLLLLHPLFTAISLVVVTSLAFIFAGIASVVLSAKLKKLKDFPKKVEAEARKNG